MKPSAWLPALVLFALPALAAAADWSPAMWKDQETLQFRTDCADEGEHWSYVWLVVLDGELYVRLGSQAAGRVDCNQGKPITAVKIGGELFPAVEMVPAPDMTERVAAAMGDKYWTDVFVRYMNHPYTMKLVPKAQ